MQPMSSSRPGRSGAHGLLVPPSLATSVTWDKVPCPVGPEYWTPQPIQDRGYAIVSSTSPDRRSGGGDRAFVAGRPRQEACRGLVIPSWVYPCGAPSATTGHPLMPPARGPI